MIKVIKYFWSSVMQVCGYLIRERKIIRCAQLSTLGLHGHHYLSFFSSREQQTSTFWWSPCLLACHSAPKILSRWFSPLHSFCFLLCSKKLMKTTGGKNLTMNSIVRNHKCKTLKQNNSRNENGLTLRLVILCVLKRTRRYLQIFYSSLLRLTKILYLFLRWIWMERQTSRTVS